jgi:hypothetical protein
MVSDYDESQQITGRKQTAAVFICLRVVNSVVAFAFQIEGSVVAERVPTNELATRKKTPAV